jgi:NAD(P)-dependent dehydrogenase (short-subunit alcohol dehydrogenase family)
MKILLTGSSSGIGQHLARHLIAQQHEVWGWARSSQDKLAQELGRNFHHTRCDVADWAQVQTAAAEVERHWGRLDGLITCAGLQGEIGRTVTTDPIGWSATVAANLNGTYHCIRALHPLLQASERRAKIVCFSGGGATKARSHFSAYAVAKTGVVRLVENIAEEEKTAPLDINAVAPGAINTRLTEEVIQRGPEVVGMAEFQAALKQRETGGGSMAKVTGLVDWLLSPQSDGISGRLLSAPWDPWWDLGRHTAEVGQSDVFTLRRIVPADRGLTF